MSKCLDIVRRHATHYTIDGRKLHTVADVLDLMPVRLWRDVHQLADWCPRHAAAYVIRPALSQAPAHRIAAAILAGPDCANVAALRALRMMRDNGQGYAQQVQRLATWLRLLD